MEISRHKDNGLQLHVKGVTLVIGDHPAKADVFLGLQSGVEAGESVRWFSGPGEYEVRGVMVDGVQTGESAVSYHVTADGIMLAAVKLSKPEDLTDSMLEHLQPASSVALWLTEGSATDVAQLIARFDAQRILPIDLPCSQEELEKALQLTAESHEKLRVTAKDLADGSQKLIALTA